MNLHKQYSQMFVGSVLVCPQVYNTQSQGNTSLPCFICKQQSSPVLGHVTMTAWPNIFLLYSSAVSSRFLTCILTCCPVSILTCLRLNLSTVHNLSLPVYDTENYMFFLPGVALPVPCLVTLRPACKILFAAPGPDPESLVSDTGQIFFLILVHFGLVWLWYIIRQFRIHLKLLQNFCVHSRPLARSAAHP